MDPNTKPSTAINTIDSSVTSLASSLVQLEIKPSTGDGPINRLPNEIIRKVIAKLRKKADYNYAEEDNDYYCYDVKQLIRLRLVSTRWRAIVEDFCQHKKSLLVNWFRYTDYYMNSAPLYVRLKARHIAREVDKTVSFFEKMPKLFPNIEQLNIRWYSPHWDPHEFDDAQIRELSVNIDSLKSLKHLEVEGQFLEALPHLSRTLAQLEHIVLTDTARTFTKDLLQIVSRLGPDCARVYLRLDLDYNQILQLHNINPPLFSNLTHLQIIIESVISEDCGKVVHLLSEHATSLKLLSFYARKPMLQLTPTVIDDLGKLTNLEEFELKHGKIDLAMLEQIAAQHRLPSVNSVLKTFTLYIDCGHPTNAAEFTRVLSIIFPNLVELYLYICADPLSTCDQLLPLVPKINQHLDRFRNLRKRDFDFWSYLISY